MALKLCLLNHSFRQQGINSSQTLSQGKISRPFPSSTRAWMERGQLKIQIFLCTTDASKNTHSVENYKRVLDNRRERWGGCRNQRSNPYQNSNFFRCAHFVCINSIFFVFVFLFFFLRKRFPPSRPRYHKLQNLYKNIK